MDDALLVQRQDHVETWTINRPHERNAISDGPTIDALIACVERVNSDHRVRAVILTGSGSAFSAGGNIKHMIEGKPPFGGSPYHSREGYRYGIQRLTKAVYSCDVPIIAAVNGPAVGAGCDLALMCDMRIASESALFAESFVKLGIIPGDGGAWLLPRAVGVARAAEMTLTGDPIDAATALDWGLVSHVVSAEKLLAQAGVLAGRVAANPPHAVRMAKKLLRESQQLSLDSVLELSAAMQALAHTTSDHREALAAFQEKRIANYEGV